MQREDEGMKTLYVGGTHFFNRFSSLEAAVKRAEHDDTIELCKDADDVELYVAKSITINGNGHAIRPKAGRTGIDCAASVALKDIVFECPSRTNAVVFRMGGSMEKVTTAAAGAVKMLYPTVVHRGGTLTIEDSSITFIETYEAHGTMPTTVTFLKRSVVADRYHGQVYLDNGDSMLSKFQGAASISESDITCAMFMGRCRISNSVLHNFNKAVGTIELISCELQPQKKALSAHGSGPADSILKDLDPNAVDLDVVPYALHIAGGKVVAEDFSAGMEKGLIGFYMTSGSLDIRNTNGGNDQASHLVKGGSLIFNNVSDSGFYMVQKASCSLVNSHVNTSMATKSAMEQLNAMVGLGGVKRQLRSIMNTIAMNMKHPEKDFGFSNHMVFAGDPGTGKTTVAKLVAQALFEVGAIPENKCMEVPASQLIKGFVGQTGGHVESVCKKALGGVLFIDEAYELAVKDGQNTFNNDAISVLLRYMEDHRHELVVIAAGYEKEMREFLASNAGLTRRFQWISFDDYSPAEMATIFMGMAAKCRESFDQEAPEVPVAEYFRRIAGFYLSNPDAKGRTTNGGNGGLVRNLFQQVVFARNDRVAEHPDADIRITEDDLVEGFKNEMKKAMDVRYGLN